MTVTNDVGPGAEIVRATPLLPMDATTARQAMDAYQALTRELLTDADWIGRPGAQGAFVKRSGWQKIATFYGVSTEVLDRTVERDEDGRPARAYVLVRATARDGRYADGDGGCATNEPRFRSASGTQKLEHDLPATAATRATNRAISNLVGFGAVSAEEVDTDVRAGAAVPDWAAPIPEDAIDRMGDNLAAVLKAAGVEEPMPSTLRVLTALDNYCGGDTIPAATARLARLLAQQVAAAATPEVSA